MTVDPRAEALLRFWFGPEPLQPRAAWFEADPAFDSAIATAFAEDYALARAGARDHWREDAADALALVLLFDQIPRNLFRGSARAFESDGAARALANTAVARGFDRAVRPVQRLFFYLPFEHSENLADQDRAVALIGALAEEGLPEYLPYAIAHRDVIRRFGRFPHRNRLLARADTPAEAEYLRDHPVPFA